MPEIVDTTKTPQDCAARLRLMNNAEALLIALQGAIANLTTLARAVEECGCPGTAEAAREGIRLYQSVVDRAEGKE